MPLTREQIRAIADDVFNSITKSLATYCEQKGKTLDAMPVELHLATLAGVTRAVNSGLRMAIEHVRHVHPNEAGAAAFELIHPIAVTIGVLGKMATEGTDANYNVMALNINGLDKAEVHQAVKDAVERLRQQKTTRN